MAYYEGETFDTAQAQDVVWMESEFESCTFSGCALSGIHFTRSKFIDCHFLDCDLSNAILSGTLFNHVHFKSCKMLGLDFTQSSNFIRLFGFENCQLDHSIFYQLKIPNTSFRNCSLKNVDFCQTDLQKCDLSGSDLLDANFDQTNLEKADLRDARHFSIHPENNKVKGLKCSLEGLPGFLHQYKLTISH